MVVRTPPSPAEYVRIRGEIARVRRLSDNLFKIGPLGVGLDGIITFVPVAGLVYGLGAGGYLLKLAYDIGAPASVLTRMAGYVGFDALTGEVPIIGDAVDFFFRGHAKAASALEKHLDVVHPEGRTRPEPRWRGWSKRGGATAPGGRLGK